MLSTASSPSQCAQPHACRFTSTARCSASEQNVLEERRFLKFTFPDRRWRSISSSSSSREKRARRARLSVFAVKVENDSRPAGKQITVLTGSTSSLQHSKPADSPSLSSPSSASSPTSLSSQSELDSAEADSTASAAAAAAGAAAEEEGEKLSSQAAQGSAVLGVLVAAAIVGVAGAGYVFKDEINGAVDFFSAYIESAGPAGYVAFTLGYAALEVLAIPAIPLTMSAGLIFGSTVGTILCSLSGTIAATVAFLIARYVARDRILQMVGGNPKFAAIDKAVGEDSFRVVTLLRLSPLLPFSLGNYMYGLTSVKLVPYILGSWIGMLPGTWAYVSAGAFGRTILDADEGGVSINDSSLWTLAAGLTLTVAAAAYVTNLAKNAVKDLDQEQ